MQLMLDHVTRGVKWDTPDAEWYAETPDRPELRLLPRFYYARRLQHLGARPSGLILPEVAREAYFDAAVEARGPEAYGARVGDRVLCAPIGFETFRDDCGFVHDRDLLGVLRAPDFATVEPANRYVLVRPDPRERVRATAGGVLVAGYSLAGDDRREKQRGYELLLEYARLLGSERYQGEPTDFDRWQLERRFVENLAPAEAEAFFEARQKQREQDAEPRNGVTLEAEDYRARAPLRLPAALQSGLVLGVGPDVSEAVPLGERVTWSRAEAAVRLAVAGDLLMLVAEAALETVIEAGAAVEFLRAA